MRNVHPERIERILIRGTNWVGDAVMSVPALREIRRIFRQARISLLVRPWVQDVYSAVDFVDEILLYDKTTVHAGLLGMRRLIVDLRYRRFDLAILLQNAFEAAWIAYWAHIPLRLGYSRDGRGVLLTHPIPMDPAVRRVHQAYYYLAILSGVDLLEERLWDGGRYRLESIAVGIRDRDRQAARAMLLEHGIKPGIAVVGMNPGASYGDAKRWPVTRFAAVADRLMEECRTQVVIFGAPGERSIAEDMAGKMKFKPAILAGRTTLGQLMGLLRECDLFITNDSGPMHLAAALGVPQLAIFGSTDEVATGPLGGKALVIKHPVACNPCFLRECPTDFGCMLGITADEVFVAAKAKLLETGAGGRIEV